ncbi:MAG: DUF1587 domain-containing protein, partial [Verrucomicrobiota bacterium]
CFDCHDDETRKGGLDVTALTFDLSDRSLFEQWVKVHDKLAGGEMPPPKKKQPTQTERSAWIEALSRSLTEADRAHQQQFGRAALRRLSRNEYANALKDVLALPHLDVEDMLPPDGLAHGYDKSAEALDFSHVMVARYLEAADFALQRAMAPTREGEPSKTIRSELHSVDGVRNTLQTLFVQLKQGVGIPLIGTRIDPTIEIFRGNFAKRDPGYVRDPDPPFDGVATFMNSRANHNIVVKPFKVTQSGTYRIRVRGFALVNNKGTLQPADRPETVAFYSPSGRLLGRCDLPPNEPATAEVTVWAEAGEPIEYLAISAPNAWIKSSGRLKPYRYHHFHARGIGLQWLALVSFGD